MVKWSSRGASLGAWLNERFPAVNFVSGLIMYLMIAGVSQAVDEFPMATHWPTHLFGAGALISLFLLLRVIDEHKDYQKDLLNHPERVLQSGRISLRDLKWVGFLCVGLQIGYVLLVNRGFSSYLAYGLVVFWSLLMAKEFFVGEWLKKRLLLYSLSHMLIASFSVLWILSALLSAESTGRGLGWLISLPFFAGMVYEIARKLRGAEEEKPTVDSYSQTLGHRRASSLLLYFAVATLANFLILMLNYFLDPHWLSFLAVGFVVVLLVAQLFQYNRVNTQKSRKAVEAVAGLFILVIYLSLIVEAFR